MSLAGHAAPRAPQESRPRGRQRPLRSLCLGRRGPRATPSALTFLLHHFHDVRIAHLRQLVNDAARAAADVGPLRLAARFGADTETDRGPPGLLPQSLLLRGGFPSLLSEDLLLGLQPRRDPQTTGLALPPGRPFSLLGALVRPLPRPLPAARLRPLPAPFPDRAGLRVPPPARLPPLRAGARLSAPAPRPPPVPSARSLPSPSSLSPPRLRGRACPSPPGAATSLLSRPTSSVPSWPSWSHSTVSAHSQDPRVSGAAASPLSDPFCGPCRLAWSSSSRPPSAGGSKATPSQLGSNFLSGGKSIPSLRDARPP